MVIGTEPYSFGTVYQLQAADNEVSRDKQPADKKRRKSRIERVSSIYAQYD